MRVFHKSQRRGGTPLGCACGIRGPRATMRKTVTFTVGRGPVPRHAAIAGETRSDARMASEGPRATGKNSPFTVGRWENLSLAMRLVGRLHPPCSSGSPDPELFVIRRSQTTEVDPMRGPPFAFLSVFARYPKGG